MIGLWVLNSVASDSRETDNMSRWGFVGSGKMATALVKGMLRAGVASVEEIRASDPLESARHQFQAETGVAVFDSNVPVVQLSDVVVLAVKPQSMRLVLENVRPFITHDHLIVSIAAGITIASIVQGLGSQARVVRVMPNTPALIGEGASAYALGPGVSADDERVVKAFLDSVGQTVGVPESLARCRHWTLRERARLCLCHDRGACRRRCQGRFTARRRHTLGDPDRAGGGKNGA